MRRSLVPLLVVPLLVMACGIDAVGTMIDAANVDGSPAPTEDATSPIDGAAGDAAADASTEGDAPIDVDAAPPVDAGPLCPTNASGLAACFPFEGSATDQSPANLVPLMAANLGFTAGHEGQGAVFTTAPKTDLRLPHGSFNTTAMTIEVWLKPASLPGSGGRYLIVDMDGRFGVSLQPDGALGCRSLLTTTKVTVGKWIHLACVNDGVTMSAYVGGKLEASVANVLGTTSVFVGIGEDSTSTNDTFDGMMDSLRIWTRALSDGEVASAAAR